MNGIESIAAERRRQIEVEGWTPEHDDEHDSGEMAAAASCYSIAAFYKPYERFPVFWPWGKSWWKPKDRRSNLVRAGALIAAEIDRLDRSAAHDARVRREALEEAWERMGHAPDPHDPGFFVCNHITVDRWYALRAAILGPESQSNEQETK